MTAFRASALSLLLLSGARARADKPVTIGEKHRIHSTVLNEDRDYQIYPKQASDGPQSR